MHSVYQYLLRECKDFFVATSFLYKNADVVNIDTGNFVVNYFLFIIAQDKQKTIVSK